MINGEVFNKVNMVVYNNMEYTKWMTYKHLMALVTCRAQNEDWKLVSHSTVYCYRVSLASPLEMYSKFVLPNYTVLGRWPGQKMTNGRALL